jgi:hypothetical protein
MLLLCILTHRNCKYQFAIIVWCPGKAAIEHALFDRGHAFF